MGVSLASVFVTIRPDLKDFPSEATTGLLKAFGQTENVVGQAGTRHGQAYGRGFARTGQEEVKKGSGGFRDALGPVAAAMAGVAGIEVFKGFIDDAREAARTARITDAVIESTGGAAHVTAAHVEELATSISNKTGIDREAVASGENLLLTFTNVRNEVGAGNDIFDQATLAVQNMATALGEDTKSASIQLGKALQDPVKGATALRRVGVQLDDQQQAQIKTFVASGHVMEAQKIILGELGKEFGGVAAAASDPMQKLGNVIHNTGVQVGTALLPAVNKFATFMAETGVPAVASVVTVLSHIPGPVYAAGAAVGGLVLAFRVGSRVFEAYKASSEAVNKVIDFFVARTTAAAAAETAEAGAADVAAASTGRLGLAAQGAGTALGTMLGRLAVGGAVAGVAALSNQLTSYLGQAEVASVDTKKLSDDLLEMDRTGRVGATAMALAKNQFALFGGEVKTGTDFLQAFGDQATGAFSMSLDNIIGRAQSGSERMDRFNKTAGQMDAALANLASSGHAKEAQNMLELIRGATNLSDEEWQHVINHLPLYTAAMGGATAATKVGAGASRDDAAAIAAANAKRAEAQEALKKLTAALQAQTEAFLASRDAGRALHDAQNALTTAIKTNGRTLDENTVKGRANEAAIDAVASATLRDLTAKKAAGTPLRQYAQLVNAARDTLIKEAVAAGMSTTAARKYADQILAVPLLQTTTYRTPGLAGARAGAQGLAHDLLSLQSRTVSVRINSDGSFTQAYTTATGGTGNRRGRATGGPISGYSPSPTADNIPIMATAGEHVWSVQEVNRVGGHAAVGALRAMARAGALRLASGGAVNRYVNVNTSAKLPQDLPERLDKALGWAGRATALPMMGAAGGGVGAGVQRWASMVLAALRFVGQPASLLGITLRRMNQESGGNPTAVNRWDSNWRAGTPSVGLMQVIGPTYRRWADGYLNVGPFLYGVSTNPMANLVASMRYALGTYGGLARAYGRAGGYDGGGWLPPGGLGVNLTGQPERVLTGQQSREYSRGRQQPVIVHVYFDGQLVDDRVRVVVEDGLASAGLALDNA